MLNCNDRTKNKKALKKNQRGLSLIELLIATTLGVVVITGVSQSLTTMVMSSRVQMDTNSMQQTADTALSYIGYRLRNALSTPCDQINDLQAKKKLHINQLKGSVNYKNSEGQTKTESINDATATKITNLLGKHGINVSTNNVNVGGKSLKTDDLLIMTANQRAFIHEDTGMETPKIVILGGFPTDETGSKTLYTVTDCENMEIFRGVKSGKNRVEIIPQNNTSFEQNYRDLESTMVSHVNISEIKIDNKGRLFDQQVFATDKDTDENVLMNNVELLRVLFAVDSQGFDGVADKYITAAELSGLKDNETVIAAELFLVVRGAEQANLAVTNTTNKIKLPVTDTALGDSIATTEVTFNDKILRKVFTRTVTFRNKAAL